jgi:hypothetical protein
MVTRLRTSAGGRWRTVGLGLLLAAAGGSAAPGRAAVGGPVAGERGGGSPAAADTSASAAAVADSLPDSLPEDLQDVAAELDFLDQPLPQAVLREALGAPAPPGNPADGGRAAPVDGTWRWRVAAREAGLRHDGRLEIAAGPLAVRAAVRLDAGAPTAAGTGLQLTAGRWRLLAGQVTVRHGYGLVAADPGRRASLGADRPLGGAGGGLGLRVSPTAGTAATRVGLETAAGPWRLAAVGGVAGSGPGPRQDVRLERHGAGGLGSDHWALLVHRDSLGVAVSCGGSLRRGDAELAWEGARLPVAGGGAAVRGVAGVTWQPGPQWCLELQSGFAGRPAGSGAAVLPAAARAGWAARLAWRARARESWELLLQGARLEPELSPPRRRTLRLAEVGWSRRLGGGLQGGARLRHTERPETAWPAGAPWEPAVTGPAGARTLVTATLDWTGGAGALTGQWRSFRAGTAAGGTPGGTRQLVALGGRRDLGRRLAVWVDAATAWGDDVDLVRAAQPLPGVVVARHWGDWASEVVAGLRLDAGPLSLRAGLARRLPATPAGDGRAALKPALEGWVEARASW